MRVFKYGFPKEKYLKSVACNDLEVMSLMTRFQLELSSLLTLNCTYCTIKLM